MEDSYKGLRPHYTLDPRFFSIKKKYFIIDQQIARHCVHYSECLSNPLSFNATQITTPFLNSRISANHDQGLGFYPIIEFLYALMILYCRISFV